MTPSSPRKGKSFHSTILSDNFKFKRKVSMHPGEGTTMGRLTRQDSIQEFWHVPSDACNIYPFLFT